LAENTSASAMKRDAVKIKSWSKKATSKEEESNSQIEEETKNKKKKLTKKEMLKVMGKKTMKKIHSLTAELPRKKKLSDYRLKQNYWPDCSD
jgi:hypothetical protein